MKELKNPFTALLCKLQARRAQKKLNKELRNSTIYVSEAPDAALKDVGDPDPSAITEAEDTFRHQLAAICTLTPSLSSASSPSPPPSSLSPSPDPDSSASASSPTRHPHPHLAALSTDLHTTARRLRTLQTRHLSATIPWLPDLPDSALHLILTYAGPTTRSVCRRFRALHSAPPVALRPCQLETEPALDTADALLSLSCLRHVTTLDLRQLLQVEPQAAAAAIARCTALRQLFLSRPLQPPEFAALLHHAATLRDLSPLSLRTGARYPPPDSLAQHLLAFTALQSLHIYEWRAPVSLAPLQCLTTLTKLSFQLLACMGSSQNSMAELLAAAVHLPLLRDLRLPAYNIAWDTTTAQLLRSFTGLATLHVGTGQVHPPQEIQIAMLGAVAALTGLTSLQLVEPIRWTTCAALGELEVLPLRALGVGHYCEYGPDTVTNNERGGMVATLACRKPLASLCLDRVPLDVEVPAAGSCRNQLSARPHDIGSAERPGHLQQLQLQQEQPRGGGALLCMDAVLGALHGTLQVLELRHCIVPPRLFESLAPLAGLQRLQVNYCWCRAAPQPGAEELPLPYSGLGRLLALTSLTLCSLGQFEAPLQELTGLTRLRELSLPQWRQQAAELWALVPLRELRALTVCQTFDSGDEAGRRDICAVLQHCVSLRRVALMGIAQGTLQLSCLSQDDILQLAQGGTC